MSARSSQKRGDASRMQKAADEFFVLKAKHAISDRKQGFPHEEK